MEVLIGFFESEVREITLSLKVDQTKILRGNEIMNLCTLYICLLYGFCKRGTRFLGFCLANLTV